MTASRSASSSARAEIEFARADTRLGLADGESLQSKPRDLPPSLLRDPVVLLSQQAVDLFAAHRPGHGQPRGFAPWHLQPPPLRSRRPTHLDRIHHRSLASDSADSRGAGWGHWFEPSTAPFPPHLAGVVFREEAERLVAARPLGVEDR